MIGIAQKGTIVATTELVPFQEVSVDHETWTVQRVRYVDGGDATVELYRPYGGEWDLEVARKDFDEPMWELV